MGGGIYPSACWDTPPGPMADPPGPKADTPGTKSKHPSPAPEPKADPPGPKADTPPPRQMATAADGTHPTGMHSCYRDGLLVNNHRGC